MDLDTWELTLKTVFLQKFCADMNMYIHIRQKTFDSANAKHVFAL